MIETQDEFSKTASKIASSFSASADAGCDHVIKADQAKDIARILDYIAEVSAVLDERSID